jgi:hypothetical protein
MRRAVRRNNTAQAKRSVVLLRLTACMALFAFHAYSLSEAILFLTTSQIFAKYLQLK